MSHLVECFPLPPEALRFWTEHCERQAAWYRENSNQYARVYFRDHRPVVHRRDGELYVEICFASCGLDNFVTWDGWYAVNADGMPEICHDDGTPVFGGVI